MTVKNKCTAILETSLCVWSFIYSSVGRINTQSVLIEEEGTYYLTTSR